MFDLDVKLNILSVLTISSCTFVLFHPILIFLVHWPSLSLFSYAEAIIVRSVAQLVDHRHKNHNHSQYKVL